MKITGLSLKQGDSLRSSRPLSSTRTLRKDDVDVAPPPAGGAILDEAGNPLLDEAGNEILEE